jgi:hypothetical protein
VRTVECVGWMNEFWDDQQRLRPGVVPGWGMSWWFVAQGVTRADRKAMPQDQWLALLGRGWQAVREGWWPDVPRSDWVGPHHPFKNDDSAR